MGRQIGGVRISGSVGDLNFYYTKNNGWLVRQKSSLSAKRFKNDPAFERARENGSNFGRSSSSAKHLRLALYDLWVKLSDSRLCSRGVSLMHKIREFDKVSDRGKFVTMIGLQNPEARALLKGFSFNDGPSSADLMRRPVATDLLTGTVSIYGLNPQKDLHTPQHATHVGFTSGFAKTDFAKQEKCAFSEEVVLPLNGDVCDIILTTPEVPGVADGISLLGLKIVFYQSVNGELLMLKNKEHCVIEVVDVGFGGADEANFANGADEVNVVDEVNGVDYANWMNDFDRVNYVLKGERGRGEVFAGTGKAGVVKVNCYQLYRACFPDVVGAIVLRRGGDT